MKKIIYIILLINLVFSQEEVMLDKISSVVENKIVLLSDVVLAANAISVQQNINPSNNPEEFLKILEQTRESMVEQLIIIEMAKKDSIEVLEKDIDRALDQQIENIISQSGGKEQAEEALGKKISTFKRSYRDDMKGKLLAEKYTSQLTSDISVSRKDVEEFYNNFKEDIPPLPTLHKTRHILIEIIPTEKTLNDSYKKALEVKNKIINNDLSFEEAAKTFSEDPGSKDIGGNLGFVSRGVFVKEFEKVAFTLNKNVLSDPIKTKYGYHLIEVLNKSGDKINVRHILIQNKLTDSDKKNAYEKAIMLKNQIKSIDEFYLQAKDHSNDNTNNLNGGLLGLIDTNNYQIKELSNIIKSIETNKISNPILTEFGYHLIWVDYIKDGGTPTLDNNWSEIESLALNKAKSEWYSSWIKQIKDNFYIKRNPLSYPQISE
jgi:peptidyl-prolyl cis-trans isomerase SurA